ncbi:hypothetical protein PoB_003594600 [Plakobranchus ocellatus]|uniref:Uncharacterized protein n=1 Tax=Plakobranchus ocellatus TaxID=259542 RepID=A0AAV4AML5_9GAST|nr:hypothetical protein PoB_003594600 [Plakobranchus ocellatus]
MDRYLQKYMGVRYFNMLSWDGFLSPGVGGDEIFTFDCRGMVHYLQRGRMGWDIYIRLSWDGSLSPRVGGDGSLSLGVGGEEIFTLDCSGMVHYLQRGDEIFTFDCRARLLKAYILVAAPRPMAELRSQGQATWRKCLAE